jgi:hypothetical protein
MDLSRHLASYEEKISILKDMIYAVIEPESVLKTVLVCGSAGIGKTYTVNKILQARSEDNANPILYRPVSGKVSVRAFWDHLKENSTYESVLFFDDADFVLTDPHCLGMLKEASDLKTQRVVNYRVYRPEGSNTVSHITFDAKLVIATNIKVKSTPHLDAVRDRFDVYDLEVTFLERLAKIQEIALNPQGSPLKNISLEGNKELLKFLIANQDNLGELLSLRTFVRLQNMYVSWPDRWQKHAEARLLKKPTATAPVPATAHPRSCLR